MDSYGGRFGSHDDVPPFGYESAFEAALDIDDYPPVAPPSPVGQDERRMQVRAYNHWAMLLGENSFPDIAELQPGQLDDFGPYGVLLDFRGDNGVADPAIAFLGEKLAEECGGSARYARLSDVPGRSLLSRITDHYLQILANQAPIGFEAEFTNDRGATVLYRGILLPWSSDGVTIDFIFGVINWKEMADAATAEALLAAIDAAFEMPVAPGKGPAKENDMDRMLDLSGFGEDDGEDNEPVSLPQPAFGSPFDVKSIAMPEAFDEEMDEDSAEPSEWGAGFSGFGKEETVYAVDYGAQGLEDGEEEDEDYDGVIDPLADQSAGPGLSSLVSRGVRHKQSVVLPGMEAGTPTASHPPFPLPEAYKPEEYRPEPYRPENEGAGENTYELPHAWDEEEPLELEETLAEDIFADEDDVAGAYAETATPAEAASTAEGTRDEDAVLDLADEMIELVEEAPAPAPVFAEDVIESDGADETGGLYDCLASARELAQTARSSEDRGRKALYQAVSRAYDFSLEAEANPGDFAELLTENGLTAQERAPMTPVVKLVFGADYDKTRLTEYASVLGYAHRTGVARGTLDGVLARAEGGLKGIVKAERQARKEAQGKPVEAPQGIRAALAKKLRKIEPVALDGLAKEDGGEFALVMVRRLPSGEVVVLGEVPEDIPLVEKAARKLIG